jgi:hypothetical protein
MKKSFVDRMFVGFVIANVFGCPIVVVEALYLKQYWLATLFGIAFVIALIEYMEILKMDKL